MKRFANTMVLLAACASMLGCSSMTLVAEGAGVAQAVAPGQDGMHSGDHVQVTMKNGGQFQVDFKEVRDGDLRGTQGGKELALPLAHIERIEKKETSVGKSVLAVGAIAIVGLVVLLAVALRNAAFFPSYTGR